MTEGYTVYESSSGKLFIYFIEGELFIGAELVEPTKLSHIKEYFKVFLELEHNLLDKGYTEVFAIVGDEGRWRFAQYMGFEPTGLVINDNFEIVRKDLFK